MTAFKNTVYLERDMPYFAFVSTNAVFVRKKRRMFGTHNPKAPFTQGRITFSRTPKKCNTLYLARQGMYCRTGVYLPPLWYFIPFIFGGRGAPPYKVPVCKPALPKTPLRETFCRIKTQNLSMAAIRLQKNSKIFKIFQNNGFFPVTFVIFSVHIR